jgi:hypothetical protein
MKTRIAIALLCMTVICLCYAKRVMWPNNEKPKISLIEAHTRALEALKPRHIDYYCLTATVARTFSECDWELHFAATNNAQIWVSIGTDMVRVSEYGFNY